MTPQEKIQALLDKTVMRKSVFLASRPDSDNPDERVRYAGYRARETALRDAVACFSDPPSTETIAERIA